MSYAQICLNDKGSRYGARRPHIDFARAAGGYPPVFSLPAGASPSVWLALHRGLFFAGAFMTAVYFFARRLSLQTVPHFM